MAIPITIFWRYRLLDQQFPSLRKERRKMKVEEEDEEDEIGKQCDYEANLTRYESTYEDYLLLCIQFGYMVLFAAVSPLASIGVLFTNILTIRLNLWKVGRVLCCYDVDTDANLLQICTLFKRPFARRIKNIGAWQSAFELLSVIAVLSNCGILYLQEDLR